MAPLATDARRQRPPRRKSLLLLTSVCGSFVASIVAVLRLDESFSAPARNYKFKDPTPLAVSLAPSWAIPEDFVPYENRPENIKIDYNTSDPDWDPVEAKANRNYSRKSVAIARKILELKFNQLLKRQVTTEDVKYTFKSGKKYQFPPYQCTIKVHMPIVTGNASHAGQYVNWTGDKAKHKMDARRNAACTVLEEFFQIKGGERKTPQHAVNKIRLQNFVSRRLKRCATTDDIEYFVDSDIPDTPPFYAAVRLNESIRLVDDLYVIPTEYQCRKGGDTPKDAEENVAEQALTELRDRAAGHMYDFGDLLELGDQIGPRDLPS